MGWIYDPINGTFTDDGSATDFALLGDLVTVRHAIGYPYSITVEDAAAIALYGLWERRVTRADAMSTEAMTALLTGLLAQQKPTRKIINYETFETGVLPGHVHTVTTAKRDFDGDVLVQEVTTTWASNSKTRRSVSAVESLVFQGTSRDTLDQWMRGGTGGTSATVSPAGLVMGPGGPRYAVQSRGPHDELYGDDYLLHDDDLGGAAYGPNVKTSRLAIKVPNDDQSILALLNASLSADKALTITQYDDGTTDIDLESGAALSINTYGVGVGGLKPRINLTSAESIVLEPNSKFVDYVRHRGLSVHDGFALADDSFTTTYTQDGVGSEPYTLLRYRGSTSVSINLIAIAAAAARIASLYCRVIAIVHDGSAGTLTIDPNSTETIGNGTAAASTFALTSGQSVLLALVSGTGGGVKILASHGMSGSGTPGGADTQVQYNDGGAFGGDANFVWNKTRQQLQVKADTNDDDSPVRVVNESTDQTVIALHPFNSDEARILLGREYAGAADIARHARPVAIVKDATDFYVEMGVGETPGSAMAFAKAVGLGFSTSGSSGGYIYAYGFGTGNVAGASFQIGRNASGNGAAGTLELMDRSGTSYFLWVEGGKLRIHTARPTEDNTTVSHTAGTVVGTQS